MLTMIGHRTNPKTKMISNNNYMAMSSHLPSIAVSIPSPPVVKGGNAPIHPLLHCCPILCPWLMLLTRRRARYIWHVWTHAASALPSTNAAHVFFHVPSQAEVAQSAPFEKPVDVCSAKGKMQLSSLLISASVILRHLALH